jgi:hypothetical protein
MISRTNRTMSVAGRRPARTVNAVSSAAIGVLVLSVPAAAAPDTREPPPINACTLLMTGELSSLLRMPIEMGQRHDAGLTFQGAYSSTCVWKVRNARLQLNELSAPMGGADFAILNVFSWPSREGAETFVRSFRSAADNHLIPMQPIALQIGDHSLWWGDGVAVQTGDVSFGVSVVLYSADRERRRMWEESLARKIVGRIHTVRQK